LRSLDSTSRHDERRSETDEANVRELEIRVSDRAVQRKRNLAFGRVRDRSAAELLLLSVLRLSRRSFAAGSFELGHRLALGFSATAVSVETIQETRTMGRRVFVGNLSFNTTEVELRDTFGQFGAVADAKIVTDRDTGRPRGFAFVEMSSDQEAQDAIAQLNGRELDGRAINVNEAQERGGGGGGRGGGFGRGGGGGRW
jgi:hypothetical protein